MTNQYKTQQTSYDDPFDTDHSQKEQVRAYTDTHVKPRRKRVFPWIFCAIGMAASLAVGTAIRKTGTMFLKENYKDGYLRLDDYVLYDQDSGDPLYNLRGIIVKEDYAFSDYYSGNAVTYRGITNGDSWEAFAEAYGEYYTDYVYIYPVDSHGDISWDDSILLNGLTVSELDEQLTTGEYKDLSIYEIDINFRMTSDGKHLYYTDDDLYEAHSDYYTSSRLSHPLTSWPDETSYVLEFDIKPQNHTFNSKTAEVTSIYSSIYHY